MRVLIVFGSQFGTTEHLAGPAEHLLMISILDRDVDVLGWASACSMICWIEDHLAVVVPTTPRVIAVAVFLERRGHRLGVLRWLLFHVGADRTGG